MTNVLANALKYSPRGGPVKVEIATQCPNLADGRANVRFVVTDAGPGVPEAFRESIFEKFFRVEHHVGDASEGAGGTGIGLYLCREVMKAHGGSIWCEAAEGGGAVVGFSLQSAG
jgi:NtrC-family two-component system sensor histidine kinase KinB